MYTQIDTHAKRVNINITRKVEFPNLSPCDREKRKLKGEPFVTKSFSGRRESMGLILSQVQHFAYICTSDKNFI